ncbi:hypothetical protein HanIR_Chr02g0065591 [Helianthus annuus]|nr:hypothetical protein HanIR_Chr02g0065591 [Helianthus annuus]
MSRLHFQKYGTVGIGEPMGIRVLSGVHCLEVLAFCFCCAMKIPVQSRHALIFRGVTGLAPEIQSHVTSANLDNIQAIQRLVHRLTNQAVDQNRLPKRISATATVTTSTTLATPSDNKIKWDGDSSKGSASVQSQVQQRKTDSYQSPSQHSSGSHM